MDSTPYFDAVQRKLSPPEPDSRDKKNSILKELKNYGMDYTT
jgi:hypothetical protein